MVAISGAIVNTLGETFTGVVSISRIKSGDAQGVGELVARVVVDDGTLATELTENEGTLDGTLYAVYFDADSGPSWSEHWLVESTEAESVKPASLVVYSTRTSPARIPGSLTVDGDLNAAGDVVGASDSAVYFGGIATAGSWRIVRSGNNLVFQRYDTDSWVTKSAIASA